MHIHDRKITAFALRFLLSNLGDEDVEDALRDRLAGSRPQAEGDEPAHICERLAAYFDDEDRPTFGWGWIDGEDDEAADKWIQISILDYTDPKHPCLGEEIAVMMVRDYDQSIIKYPYLKMQREREAQLIVDSMNLMYGEHTIEVEIEGGCCVDLIGLPETWNYQVNDNDMGEVEPVIAWPTTAEAEGTGCAGGGDNGDTIKVGDAVYWNDPDKTGDDCSKNGVVKEVDYVTGKVLLEDGTEVLLEELQEPKPDDGPGTYGVTWATPDHSIAQTGYEWDTIEEAQAAAVAGPFQQGEIKVSWMVGDEDKAKVTSKVKVFGLVEDRNDSHGDEVEVDSRLLPS